MRIKWFLIAIFITGLLSVICCTQKPEEQKGEVENVQYDKAEMKNAIETAQSTFDAFVERFKNPQPGDEDFNVKVRIKDKSGVEDFWIGDLKLDAEPYSGIIGHDPGVIRSVKMNQEYSFSRSDIVDWMYMENGKMQGNYTLRVLLKSMPEEEAEQIKKNIGW